MTTRYSKYYSEVFHTTRKHLLKSNMPVKNVNSHDYNSVSLSETLSTTPVGFYPEESDFALSAGVIDNNDVQLYVKDPTEIMGYQTPKPSGNKDYKSKEEQTTGQPEKNDDNIIAVEEIPESKVIEKARDEDFMQDIKSIISGKKKYDPASKKVSDKKPEPEANKEQERNQTENKTDTRHEIFNKIAQSMRYANAYDIGPVEMKKRFDDFDRMDELKNSDKKEMQSKASPADVKNKHIGSKIEQADQTDFINDLDIIRNKQTEPPVTDSSETISQKKEETQAMEGSGPENENSTDTGSKSQLNNPE